MNNLIVRSIAGIVFSAAVIASAFLGQLALGLLFLVFAIIGLYEVYELVRHKDVSKPKWFIGVLTGIFLYLILFLIATDSISPEWLWIFAAIIPVMFCIELLHLDKGSLYNVAINFFGWIYVILPFGLINFLPLVNGQFEYQLPLGYFLILWANDTGAYFVGKFFGRNKLYERVSPNKTWEGLFGGVLLSVGVAVLLSEFFDAVRLIDWIAVSVIVAVFGNLGDLFESHLKRNFGVKDSGSIIPGHGGVLDRFDGLLLSLPVIMCYFKLITSL